MALVIVIVVLVVCAFILGFVVGRWPSWTAPTQHDDLPRGPASFGP